MKMQGNTILITGGSSGIGQGLAEAFHKLGNQVIISGRREANLRNICAANTGMRYFVMDVSDLNSIRNATARILAEFPETNCVFNNAGVQKRSFRAGQPVDDAAIVEEVNTNLLGVIRMSGEVIPHLKNQSGATLVNVSSALAFIPISFAPIYCATKAAVHSFTLALRHQLKGSNVKAIEIIPPYVATELGGPSKSVPGAPQPMPLDTFIADTMRELAGDADEIAIGDAKGRVAADPETAKKIFAAMNR